MRRHIPNIITLMNLLCGSAAVILSLWELYFPAWLFIILAAVFDFFDGFCARLLKAYSAIGKELDSLADLISFGLAPSLMFFMLYYKGGHEWTALAFVPLIVVAFSALRLAKFNVDTRQSVDFLGLPTPANAMIIASMAAYYHILSIQGAASPDSLPQFSLVAYLIDSSWFIPVVSIALSLLLVSEIPMFSFKKKRLTFKDSPLLIIFLIGSLIIVVLSLVFAPHFISIFYGAPLWMLLIFCYYIILNFLKAL